MFITKVTSIRFLLTNTHCLKKIYIAKAEPFAELKALDSAYF